MLKTIGKVVAYTLIVLTTVTAFTILILFLTAVCTSVMH